MAANYDILLKLQEKIALECDNIQFYIIDQTSGFRKPVDLIGSLILSPNYIFNLGYRDYSIDADSFVGLYQQIKTIINLRILLLVTIEQSVLDSSILISIVDSLEMKLSPVVRALNDISENNFMSGHFDRGVIDEAKNLIRRDTETWNKYKSKFLN